MDNKICPLMMLVDKDNPCCKGESCAWYSESYGQCSFRDLGWSIGLISEFLIQVRRG